METLKERLNFDNDVPRITMLTVLKKATATIQLLKQKKQCLESYEDSEKQRCVQLLKRRQALRKKLEEKRSRSLKLQSWKERNRNCSECSIATTSSDDSEMDLRSGSNLVAQSVNNGAQIQIRQQQDSIHVLTIQATLYTSLNIGASVHPQAL
ncbi:unnamed protein product [Heterobilharzia americana]|nr:unnamed protein product [Heterobilharzia americana]